MMEDSDKGAAVLIEEGRAEDEPLHLLADLGLIRCPVPHGRPADVDTLS